MTGLLLLKYLYLRPHNPIFRIEAYLGGFFCAFHIFFWRLPALIRLGYYCFYYLQYFTLETLFQGGPKPTISHLFLPALQCINYNYNFTRFRNGSLLFTFKGGLKNTLTRGLLFGSGQLALIHEGTYQRQTTLTDKSHFFSSHAFLPSKRGERTIIVFSALQHSLLPCP